MDDQIAWTIELAIEPKHLAAFRELAKAMIANARTEPGTLTYEFYVSEDGRICHIYERYSNDAAAQQHSATFASKFEKRFLELATPTRLHAYGRPDAKTRANLDGPHTKFLAPFDGLRR